METQTLGPSMPLYALAPTVLAVIVALLLLARRLPTPATRFLVLSVGMRPLLGSMHQITFSSSPVGLSWNALASVMVFVVGLITLRRRSLSWLIWTPLVPILLVSGLSGLLNGQVAGFASFLIKFGYMAVLATATVEAIEDIGFDQTMKSLIPPLLTPLLFQLVGLPLGVVKAGEDDGSASYIGGFNHEAGFSVQLLGTMLVICLARNMTFRLRIILLGWCSLGILLANYRTAVLAVLPLLGCTLLVESMRQFTKSQRALMGGMLVVLIGGTGLALATTQEERFADLSVVVQKGGEIIKPPEQFSIEDRHVMSGRSLIWSNYVYSWVDGSPIQHAIGYGPEAWIGRFKVYAHNTLVSALYELGIVGVACYLLLWIWFLLLALRAPVEQRIRLLAAHLSFFLVNMATMPMWLIEGMIYYGVLCGATVALAKRPRLNHLDLINAGALIARRQARSGAA